ncbi:Glucan endo-1,3-beta-glucosidase 1 [Acorus gramineus]|uniref:Glucan endo-1,3-beta-glucosidase 1 n=1 Tax=Acorus gramineus TaxID=55184 RepID=A0AAV9BYX7_ACOGR|nr:Glucan endo-1,3-beta-glucosidase 1 [Acorus gramineus]
MAVKAIIRSLSFFFFFFFFLIHCFSFASGTLIGFSIDGRRRNSGVPPPPVIETLALLRSNNIHPSHIRVSVDEIHNHKPYSGISVDLYMNGSDLSSRVSAVSWIRTHLMGSLQHMNITSITVSSDSIIQNHPHLLLPTLISIHSALKTLDLHHHLKLSIAVSLSRLENLDRTHNKNLFRILDYIRKSGSFIAVDTIIKDQFNLGDQFIRSVVERAIFVSTVLHPYKDLPLVLHVRTPVVSSGVEVSEFIGKTMNSMCKHPNLTEKLHGLFVEISPFEEIFHFSHRELLNMAPKTTAHDDLIVPSPTGFLPAVPITNPVTTPVTIPSSSPSPGIITVPSTNPVTVLPTNPLTPTIPITVPATNPLQPPITAPPITPILSPPPPPVLPVTNPTTAPVTNPVTGFPTLPPGGIPITTPPVTTAPPGLGGQSWCVARTGSLDSAMQLALDYACGIGGADCSAIQQTGSCYNPNTLQNHASYAFNSYYQKNPVASSCDFGGTAMVVNTNPSSATCIYASSSPNAAVLNTNNNTTNPAAPASSVFGSDSPIGNSSSVSASTGLQPLLSCALMTAWLII